MRFERMWVSACMVAGLVGVWGLGVGGRPCYADPPADEKEPKKEVKSDDEKEQKKEAKSDAEAVQEVVEAFKDQESRKLTPLASGLARRLTGNDEEAKALAAEVLKAKGEFTTDKNFIKQLDKLAKKNAPVAARWLLQFARAWRMAGQQPDAPRHIVVGQVTVEGGKLDPTMVLAQMQILDEGYFAGEVGDLKKPLTFRAHGYEEKEVTFKGKEGEVICLPAVKLKAISKRKQAALKGQITADGKPDWSKVTATLSLSVPTPNTPGRTYYMPRPKWPEPVKVEVSEKGELSASGLTPTTYTFKISAEGYADFSKSVTFKAGEVMDLGECRLKSTDIGFYVGSEAPAAKELTWEEDYAAALEKAEKEKKPIMVMHTATWCGWCKVLEKKVFTDPWIQHFMSPFVVVKEFENKKLMEEWKVTGFPTLVFTDSSGKMVHKVVGYKPNLEFAGELAKALKALDIEFTPEMQKLIDKKVISGGGEKKGEKEET